MSEFEYRCVDTLGKSSIGVISAPDAKEARTRLRERGLVTLELIVKTRVEKKTRFGRKKTKDQDIYNLARELNILLRSGMKIDQALRLLISSVEKPQLKNSLSEILKDISSGKSVAQAFTDTRSFSPLMTTTIHVGESVGDLKTAFDNIAAFMKFQINFKNEIRNAMTYPLFLISASFVTLIVIFKFIVPRFFSIFGERSVATLPLPAKALYFMSNALNQTSLLFFSAVIVSGILLRKNRRVREWISRAYAFIIFLPLAGSLVLYLELSRFSFSMYSMLNSGIEFIKALNLSASLIQNKHLRGAIEPAIGQIRGGKKIAEVFSQISMLPGIVPNMITVGESGGNLKEIFFELHQIFDERFKNTVKKALILIEPIIITIMGLIVGFIVISLILTVMGVSNIKL